ncbi:hypothetical protein J4V17_24555, partial [Escherichia coli]
DCTVNVMKDSLLSVMVSAGRSECQRVQTDMVVNDMKIVPATAGPAVPIHADMCPLMLKA